jgi:hypothetical protein
MRAVKTFVGLSILIFVIAVVSILLFGILGNAFSSKEITNNQAQIILLDNNINNSTSKKNNSPASVNVDTTTTVTPVQNTPVDTPPTPPKVTRAS